MSRSRIAAALADGLWRLPEAGLIGLFRPRAGTDLSALPLDRLRAVVTWAPDADTLAAHGVTVAAEDETGFTASAVFVTRSRAESLGLIAEALARTLPGGAVLVDGQRDDGIDGIWRSARAALGAAESLTMAHGRAFVLQRTETLPAAVADWATAARPRRDAGGWLTRPGVFSADGPDPGSVLLAGMLAPPMGRLVADLGAGWGYLAAHALRADPGIERLDLIEADANALDCARENVTDPRAGFHWQDAAAWAPGAIYDTVLMNPPFHAGRAADPALGQAFIARGAAALRPRGRLFLVANRHLPYEAALDAGFAEHRTLDDAGGFKLILAERPRQRPPRAGRPDRLRQAGRPQRGRG